jgi:hypothetical protein
MCNNINDLECSSNLAHDMHYTMARVDYDKAGFNVSNGGVFL